MRMVTAAVLTAGLMVAGCDKGGGSSTPAATPTPSATSTVAPAGFNPPTTISRADYGGRIERRFRRLDKNGDGKLQRGELPPARADRLLRRMDANGDGGVDATEWSQGMLKRFDRMDANHDGNLTSDERGKRGAGRGGPRRQRPAQPVAGMADEGDEVDNGF